MPDYSRGGVVHGPGVSDTDLPPVAGYGYNRYLLTAAQASARTREALRHYWASSSPANIAAADEHEEALAAEHRGVCRNCGQPIRVMVNRGTGVCSEQCRKALNDES